MLSINSLTLQHVPKTPDLNGQYDEPLFFTLVVEGAPNGPYTQTLTYQSDYNNKSITTQFTRTCRDTTFGWSEWVLSACSRPIELYSNENFYLIVNPVGRTATVSIDARDKNFGNTLTNGNIIRYVTLNGNISVSEIQVIPSAYRPHFQTALSFVSWDGIVGWVLEDGCIRIAVNTKGTHDVRASATWVY